MVLLLIMVAVIAVRAIVRFKSLAVNREINISIWILATILASTVIQTIILFVGTIVIKFLRISSIEYDFGLMLASSVSGLIVIDIVEKRLKAELTDLKIFSNRN